MTGRRKADQGGPRWHVVNVALAAAERVLNDISERGAVVHTVQAVSSDSMVIVWYDMENYRETSRRTTPTGEADGR